MPEPARLILRYFDCRGRAQALRDVLIDAGVDFRDERLVVGPSSYPSRPIRPSPARSVPCPCCVSVSS